MIDLIPHIATAVGFGLIGYAGGSWRYTNLLDAANDRADRLEGTVAGASMRIASARSRLAKINRLVDVSDTREIKRSTLNRIAELSS